VSLSFREHAAIAFATARDGGTDLNVDQGTSTARAEVRGEWACTDAEAATMAQDLADVCCKKFGHDGLTKCARCGGKVK